MDKRANIARLLTELDDKSPRGFAIALHIRSHAPTFLFQTFPADWTDHYHAHGLVMKDPAMRWAFGSIGAIRWRDLTDDDPDGVMGQAKRFGMAYGFTWSAKEPGTRSLGGFARDDRDFLDFEMDEIDSLMHQLHQATDGLTQLSAADQNALKRMSIRMTHN